MSLDSINDIIAGLSKEMDPQFDAMVVAEQEIDGAVRRDPAAADRIQHSFVLLRPTHPLMGNPVLYRPHCAEVLDRVARGEDTRPGTAAECCIALIETSQVAPLRASAVGLLARMLLLAGLPPSPLGDTSEHYEALHSTVIDDNEAWLRQRLRQTWRAAPPADSQPQPPAT